MRKLPQVIENVHAFVEENFRSDLFVTPASIEAEMQERLDKLLHPPIQIRSTNAGDVSADGRSRINVDAPDGNEIPFVE